LKKCPVEPNDYTEVHKINVARNTGTGRYTANVRMMAGAKLISCLDIEFHIEKSLGSLSK